MDRREAEYLYASGKEPTVSMLLHLDAENKQLKEEIIKLERNSQNSSKPPSSDNPKERYQKDTRHNKGKRRSGGQPGHEGTHRQLIPVEEVDLEEMSDAIEPVDKELKEALPSEPVINADETGWRDRWLWIFVASTFLYFRVATSRSSQVLVDVLGIVYKGILCVDRWGAYTKYHIGLMQICWVYLKRDFLWIAQIGQTKQSADAISFAKRMEKLRKKLLALWYRFKEEKISRDELIQQTKPVRTAIEKHLKTYKDSEERCVRSLAQNLLKRTNHLFTFIFYEGVESTNNISERGFRTAVQWRKICFGNRSDNGSILTSRLLTATRTCWFQKRNPLEFLVETITAFRSGMPTPSLL